MKTADQQIVNLLKQIADAQSNAVMGYSLQAGGAAFNPADATTYFFGNARSLVPGNALSTKIFIPKAGTIKSVYLHFVVFSTLGSSEASSVYVRVNDTTDTLVTSTLVLNAVYAAQNNSLLSIPVSAGDFIEMKWVCPTWATNPLTVVTSAGIYIE